MTGRWERYTRSKDNVIRRVCVKYFNHTENKPRFTDRAVRSLVRLFNVEDSYFIEDMAKVEKMMTELQKNEVPRKVEPKQLLRKNDGTYKVKGSVSTKCRCCCVSHCQQSVHSIGGSLLGVSLVDKENAVDVSFPKIYEGDFFDNNYEIEPIKSSLLLHRKDAFYDVLLALETNFNLKEETTL